MTIYSEFLFMENALSGAVILLLTGRLCGYRADLKIAAGSIMCGLYAFIIFIDMHWLPALLSKVIFSVLVVGVTFMPPARRAFLKATVTFYVVSFLMGGITIAVMYMTGRPGVSANGSIYLYGMGYLQILTGIIVTAAAGIWLSEHLKEKVHRESVIMEAEVHIEGKVIGLMAFADTGNFLKDPASGYPAAVVSLDAEKRILQTAGESAACRNCVIPYHTIGRKGVMSGIRPDYIIVGGHRIEKVVLAFGGAVFDPWKGLVDYDLLLHQQLFEGRI